MQARLNDDREPEFRTTVADGFTLVAVGDCITPRPLAPRVVGDDGFAKVVEQLRGASVAFGNLETTIVDIRGFPGSPRTVDDWGLVALPPVAQDLVDLGFDLVGRANNHAMDMGVEGLAETGRRLDDAGLAHAGAGTRLASARAPRYIETPLGRVGLVSFAVTHTWDNDAALDPFGEMPGRPGISALRGRRDVSGPAGTFETLRELGRTLEPWSAPAEHSELTLFDHRFVPGEHLEVRHAVDDDDLGQILRAVRLGKRHSDLLVVTAHVHEEGPDEATPPAFVRDVARATIDSGADVFVGHGVHRIWPVEIHRGRPILYGLGNFIFSDVLEPVHGFMYASTRERIGRRLGDPARATDADVTAELSEGYADERYYVSVVAEIEYVARRPTVRLHPIDLRGTAPLIERGIPRAADPDRASTFLKHLEELSAPFGASIETFDGIGLVSDRR